MPSDAWSESRDGSTLERVLEFADFSEAFAFLTRVALLAEKRNHHPDVQLSWNRLTLTLTTHDAGGSVTDKDRELAGAIDELGR